MFTFPCSSFLTPADRVDINGPELATLSAMAFESATKRNRVTVSLGDISAYYKLFITNEINEIYSLRESQCGFTGLRTRNRVLQSTNRKVRRNGRFAVYGSDKLDHGQYSGSQKSVVFRVCLCQRSATLLYPFFIIFVDRFIYF